MPETHTQLEYEIDSKESARFRHKTVDGVGISWHYQDMTTTTTHRHPATTDWSKILRDTLQANVAAATDTQLIDSLAKLVARDATR